MYPAIYIGSKDDFSLYPTRTVGEVNDVNGQAVSHPTNIPSSATVYINDIEDPTTVMGYRDGNQWFSSDGVAVNDLESITPSGYVVPQPYLVQGVSTYDDVSSNAFEDYKPQINIVTYC
jgi:hypothetical protein